MKNLYFVLLLNTFFINAQFSIKSNVLNILVNRADIAVSYELGDRYEIELSGGFGYSFKTHLSLEDFTPNQRGSFFKIEAKYFLLPEHSKFYIGTYIRKSDFSYRQPDVVHLRDFYSNVIATGISIGHKSRLNSHLVIDKNIGYGYFLKYDKQRYVFSENIAEPVQYKRDLTIKLALGYRF
jgi:hypothetical protein